MHLHHSWEQYARAYAATPDLAITWA